MKISRCIIGLIVALLFSAVCAGAMPMAPTASNQAEFFPHQQAVIAEHTDVHFAARAPSLTGPNVAFTGAAFAEYGVGFVMHGHETHVASLDFGADFEAPNTTRLTNADFPTIRSTVSQKQNRHIEGRPEYRGGGTLSSQADAQRVLDAYHGSNVEILGSTSQGFPVVRFSGVTGTNNNVGAGITNQPTNVFIIKGTASPSVVPANPNWTP